VESGLCQIITTLCRGDDDSRVRPKRRARHPDRVYVRVYIQPLFLRIEKEYNEKRPKENERGTIRRGRIEGWAVALHIGKYTRRGEADSFSRDG